MRNDLLLLNCLPEKSAAPETDGFTRSASDPNLLAIQNSQLYPPVGNPALSSCIVSDGLRFAVTS